MNQEGAQNPNYLPMVAGRYYFVPNATATSTGTTANSSMRAVISYIPNQITVTRLGAEVTGAGDAGSKVRLGIYEDSNGLPNRLVVDAGQIAGDSATVQELTISTTIGPGWYWFAWAVQSAPVTPPTMRVAFPFLAVNTHGPSVPVAGGASAGAIHNGAVTGALPATFATIGMAGSAYRIFIKT